MIMKKIFVLGFAAVVVLACSKDKFQTKPQITVKELSSDIVPANSALRVTLEFTDKEGDVTDTIYMVRERLNQNGLMQTGAVEYPIPDFPASSSGEIELILDYTFGLTFGMDPILIPGTGGQEKERDTLNLKFVVQDKEGNKSDTAIANVIVIR